MKNARKIIEAEDPKSVFKKATGWATYDRLKELLLGYGFAEREMMGKAGFDKTRYFSQGKQCHYYFVSADERGGGNIGIYRDYGDGKGLQYQETVHCSNMDYLLKHLRLFRIIESEDPKSVFRQMVSPVTVTKEGNVTTTLTDGAGNTISIDWTFGTPCIGWLRYEQETGNEQIGARLLKAAYTYLRKKHEYRCKASIRTTRAKSTGGNYWDVERDDPAEIGNLIHTVEPDVVTSASGMVRMLTLENVLSLEPGGNRLRLDKRPKAPRSIWTHRRRTEQGEPEPYHRMRTLPGGQPLEIVVAYRKDKAPTKLLSLAKKYGPEVAKMAHWAADDLAHVLQDKGITLVVTMPSAKPLARRLARLLADRLAVPFEDRVEKTGSVSKIPIPNRKAVAPSLYSVSGKFKGQVVCLVDDYVVTAASLMAAAGHVYQAGAKKVLAAAFAI